MSPELLTVGEVAAIFRCHHETVRKMIVKAAQTPKSVIARYVQIVGH